MLAFAVVICIGLLYCVAETLKANQYMYCDMLLWSPTNQLFSSIDTASSVPAMACRALNQDGDQTRVAAQQPEADRPMQNVCNHSIHGKHACLLLRNDDISSQTFVYEGYKFIRAG